MSFSFFRCVFDVLTSFSLVREEPQTFAFHISAPYNFQHVQHVSMSSDGDFQVNFNRVSTFWTEFGVSFSLIFIWNSFFTLAEKQDLCLNFIFATLHSLHFCLFRNYFPILSRCEYPVCLIVISVYTIYTPTLLI
jgi:hypothetical protein